jgi:hypothetical protein
MIDGHDAGLQRVFDERLLRVLPPPRTPRRRSRARFAGTAVAVLLTAGGFGFATDVNKTADAAGLSCTDVLAKVEIWFESVKNGTVEQQIQFKQKAAELVGQTCNSKGEKVPFANKPVVPASEPMLKPTVPMTPECLAAQERAKEMAASASTMTRAQELELKQRINEMLAGPCAAAR